MMNANEARAKTTENLNLDEAKRMESLRAWVEETCGNAIDKAVEARKFQTCVEVPRTHDADDVATVLRKKGYMVSLSWGANGTQIAIDWRRA